MKKMYLAATATCLLLGGCNVLGVGCDSIALPGVSVWVFDSVSGSPVHGVMVTATVQDGDYQDEQSGLSRVDSYPIALAFERPGTYDVGVTAEGYAPWTVDNIRVRNGACHVRTERVDARLQKTTEG